MAKVGIWRRGGVNKGRLPSRARTCAFQGCPCSSAFPKGSHLQLPRSAYPAMSSEL